MVNLQILIARCKEILSNGKEAIDKQDTWDIVKNLASIENIFRIFYPNNIPDHLTLDHIQKSLTFLYLGSTGDQYKAFRLLLARFEGFTEDLEKGLLTERLENMISLDLYSDLLEQAKELRKNNTEPLNRAACVLARIALEDTLKKICQNRNITPANDKADQANIALRAQNVYSETVRKQVDSWLAIGNAAAHPITHKLGFDQLQESEMDDMIKHIKEFSLKFLV